MIKEHSKPLTYATLRKKLEKVGKPNAADLDKCMQQIEADVESATLTSLLRSPTSPAKTALAVTSTMTTSQVTTTPAVGTSIQTPADVTGDTSVDEATEPGVLRRFPSLTWRQANERARILFYKVRK